MACKQRSMIGENERRAIRINLTTNKLNYSRIDMRTIQECPISISSSKVVHG